MKKKIVSLMLLTGMLLSALAGCSSGTDTMTATQKAAAAAKTATITLTAITGESTTPEAIEAVQAAMNKISKSEFKTQVILQLKTADEYVAFVDSQAALIEEKIAEEEAEAKRLKAEKKAQRESEKLANAGKKNRSKWTTTKKEETEENTGETQEMTQDAYGREIYKYPELEGPSLDIIFISGIDMFNYFIDKEYITILNEELSNGSKILNKYIYPSFLNAGRETSAFSSAYAIPTNHIQGEYTYMLIDKSLAKKYGLKTSEVSKLTDLEGFLDKVKENEPDYVPLNEAPELSYVQYYNGERSMIGTVIRPNHAQNSPKYPKNLLLDKSYVAHYALLDKLNAGNYVGTGDKYAVQFVKGYITAPEVNGWDEQYDVVVYEKPIATNESVFEGMFAVSEYTKDVGRCMEIVTLLNTNEEYRNTYAFGVEGVNYEFNENGTVHMLNDDWSMNFFHTGNTFIGASPDTLPADYAEAGKLMNKTTLISPFMKWVYENEKTEPMLAEFNPVAEKYLTAFDAATDKTAYVNSVTAEMKENEILSTMLNVDITDSIACSYADFQMEVYPTN